MGEVFNITDGEFGVSGVLRGHRKRVEFKRPPSFPPVPDLAGAGLWRTGPKSVFRRKNKPNPPRATQAQLKFAGLNLDFSIAQSTHQARLHRECCSTKA